VPFFSRLLSDLPISLSEEKVSGQYGPFSSRGSASDRCSLFSYIIYTIFVSSHVSGFEFCLIDRILGHFLGISFRCLNFYLYFYSS
jgi:hypothetical protein